MVEIIVRALIGAVFALLDALVGWFFLRDNYPTLGYWGFFGIAVFGTAIVGSALFIKELRD